MDVLSVSPMRAASVAWQPTPGTWLLTVVCKATYCILPITSEFAPEQEDPNEEENHWNDDAARSVYSPSDLSPFKPRAEVILVGAAFAPRGKPTGSLVARLIVGEVDKSIEVFGERSFSLDGALRDAARFARIPLLYERAAGGPATDNPVGVSPDAHDTRGATSLPNLQPPGLAITSPADYIAPVGFGPIAARWPSRQRKLGRLAGAWSEGDLAAAPLPEGIDPGYFMAAAADQHLEALRSNERIILEHLHAQHERLVTSLPGLAPRAFVDRPGGVPYEIAMAADTLWIDTGRALCTLTWRARVPIDHPRQPGRVVLGMSESGQPYSWADVEPLLAHPSAVAARHEPSSNPEDGAVTAVARVGSEPRARALPFATAPQGAVDATVDAPHSALSKASPAWLQPAPRPPPPAPPRPLFAPPAVAPAPPPLHLEPPPVVQPPRQPSEPAYLPSVSAAPQTVGSLWSSGKSDRASYAPPPPPAPPSFSGIAASASPPAAASTPVAAPAFAVSAQPGREAIELVWFDPTLMARLRAARLFREIVARKDKSWLAVADSAKEGPEPKDRRDVVRALTQARPLDSAGIARALDEAFDDEGAFLPPLAVLTGELVLRFDPREALKATLAAVRPLMANDKKLSEAVAAATELLRSDLQLPDDVADGLTHRVEVAFAQAPRAVAPSYLRSTVDKLLLEGRHYLKKNLLGEPRLRAELTEDAQSTPVPAYLPATIAATLPLFVRFRVSVLAELRFQEDQYEASTEAIVILALGRAVRRRGEPRQ